MILLKILWVICGVIAAVMYQKDNLKNNDGDDFILEILAIIVFVFSGAIGLFNICLYKFLKK